MNISTLRIKITRYYNFFSQYVKELNQSARLAPANGKADVQVSLLEYHPQWKTSII